MQFRVASLSVGLLFAAAGLGTAQQVDGEVRSYEATVSEYPQGTALRGAVNAETVSSPGAAFLRLRFQRFRLAPGDFLTISSPDGSHNEVISEARGPHGDGEFWSFAIPGDTAYVQLHAGPRRRPVRNIGYRISQIVHGTVPLDDDISLDAGGMSSPQAGGDFGVLSVCGTKGYENIVCQPSADGPRRAVARLMFVSGSGSSARCTGWLVRGSNGSTLMTNNHCFATASAVRATEAQFNYRTTTCTGSTLATRSSYRGNTLLRTSSSLDYTLMTLLNNPEPTWGEIVPLRRKPSVNELIWVIQHPAGQPQKIGHWEDAAKTSRCKVNGINRTKSGYTSGSQMDYMCDTEGGSSGSVVLAAGTNRAVGLHHLGGCPNAATQMADICSNAGSLIQCE